MHTQGKRVVDALKNFYGTFEEVRTAISEDNSVDKALQLEYLTAHSNLLLSVGKILSVLFDSETEQSNENKSNTDI